MSTPANFNGARAGEADALVAVEANWTEVEIVADIAVIAHKRILAMRAFGVWLSRFDGRIPRL